MERRQNTRSKGSEPEGLDHGAVEKPWVLKSSGCHFPKRCCRLCAAFHGDMLAVGCGLCQQDNPPPCYKTKMFQEWFEELNEFVVQTWPPRYPNLNPIVHLWDVLDKQVWGCVAFWWQVPQLQVYWSANLDRSGLLWLQKGVQHNARQVVTMLGLISIFYPSVWMWEWMNGGIVKRFGGPEKRFTNAIHYYYYCVSLHMHAVALVLLIRAPVHSLQALANAVIITQIN